MKLVEIPIEFGNIVIFLNNQSKELSRALNEALRTDKNGLVDTSFFEGELKKRPSWIANLLTVAAGGRPYPLRLKEFTERLKEIKKESERKKEKKNFAAIAPPEYWADPEMVKVFKNAASDAEISISSVQKTMMTTCKTDESKDTTPNLNEREFLGSDALKAFIKDNFPGEAFYEKAQAAYQEWLGHRKSYIQKYEKDENGENIEVPKGLEKERSRKISKYTWNHMIKNRTLHPDFDKDEANAVFGSFNAKFVSNPFSHVPGLEGRKVPKQALRGSPQTIVEMDGEILVRIPLSDYKRLNLLERFQNGSISLSLLEGWAEMERAESMADLVIKGGGAKREIV